MVHVATRRRGLLTSACAHVSDVIMPEQKTKTAEQCNNAPHIDCTLVAVIAPGPSFGCTDADSARSVHRSCRVIPHNHPTTTTQRTRFNSRSSYWSRSCDSARKGLRGSTFGTKTRFRCTTLSSCSRRHFLSSATKALMLSSAPAATASAMVTNTHTSMHPASRPLSVVKLRVENNFTNIPYWAFADHRVVQHSAVPCLVCVVTG